MRDGLHIEGVHHAFGATRALNGVSLHITPGSIHALIGENGAGKSTLVKILSGVLQPDRGVLSLGSQPYTPANASQAHAAGVATVHQELSLAPHLTVAESLFLGREPTRFGLLDRQRMNTEAATALANMERDDIPLAARILDLSIADRQIVEIARALQTQSRVLILDEPTSSLTREDGVRLFDLLRQLVHHHPIATDSADPLSGKPPTGTHGTDLRRPADLQPQEQPLAIIYISHFLEEVVDLTDTYTVLRDGRVAARGRTADTGTRALAISMVGHDQQQLRPSLNRGAADRPAWHDDDAPILLQVEALQGEPLPLAASMQLRAGEILGIGGLVGAGRSELVRTLFGLQPVRAGHIRVLDLETTPTPATCLEAGLGLLSEDRAAEGLAMGLSLADNLVMSRWPRRCRGWLDLDARDRAAQHWIETLGIRSHGIDAPVGRLSGGNQQKVALARLLHHDVDVLLLDEPTRGIDIASKQTIYATIQDLAAQGKAILLTSSHLPELLKVCDRIAIMHRGHLGAFRNAEACSEHSLMLEASLGASAQPGTLT